MIVIATNNGSKYIDSLMASLVVYGPAEEKILIVDTQSSDPEYMGHLKTLQARYSKRIDIEIAQTPYAGYDTGAYIWAYRNYREPEYMFMQDSMFIKKANWLQQFRDKWTDGISLVSWLKFNVGYDGEAQKDFVMKNIGVTDTGGWGVFGPIFYTRLEIMDLFESKGLLNIIPTNKIEQMAMERGWAAISTACGLASNNVDEYNDMRIVSDNYDIIRKVLPKRD